MRYLLRYLIAGLAVSLTLMALSTAPAAADPVGNRSQDCKSVDDLGLASHGLCVTDQTPEDICRYIAASRVESFGSAAYPYRMQVFILNADNVAVPATPVLTINRFGECMGAFAPWSIDWIAVGVFDV
jgi:hypothetical protein